MKLNGRRLVGGEIIASQAPNISAAEACQTVSLRVPSRALGEGFVLTGSVEIGSGRESVWGVGEMAMVEVQVGEVHLLGSKSDTSAVLQVSGAQ